MRFSQEFIEQVRDANNLVDILSEYTSFRRTGTQHMARCPMPGHNERSPSFSVSETKQVYHCFGCGKSGNIFDALRELRSLNFPEAVEYLADRAGIDIPKEAKQKNSYSGDADLKKKLWKINKEAAFVFEKNLQQLHESNIVKQYCQKRGLTPEVCKEFHIGYAKDQWEDLVKHFDQLKTSRSHVQKLGLIRARKEGDGHYDLFRHRLMFPIQDHRGEFVGFGGRALAEDQKPKYINSHESDVFQKGKTFYGLNVTGKYIRQKDAVVVVEGYMDFLALYSVGIHNVVATLGTALTSQHARLLKRFTRNIVILFDGDSAGAKAAERSLPILLGESLVPKAVVLPDNLDPDDYLKRHGVDDLRQVLVKAPELFNLQLEREMKTYTGDSSAKLKLMDTFTPILNKIEDIRLKSLYMEEIARVLSVDMAWVDRALRQEKPLQRPEITTEAAQSVKPLEAKILLANLPLAEMYLLNLAQISSERFEAIWNSEIVPEFSHLGAKELMVKAREFYGQNPNTFDKLSAYLMSLTDSPTEVGRHLGEPFQSLGDEELDRMQSDCIKQVRAKYLKTQAREIATRMRNQPATEQIKELERIMNVQKAKKSLNSKLEN